MQPCSREMLASAEFAESREMLSYVGGYFSRAKRVRLVHMLRVAHVANVDDSSTERYLLCGSSQANLGSSIAVVFPRIFRSL